MERGRREGGKSGHLRPKADGCGVLSVPKCMPSPCPLQQGTQDSRNVTKEPPKSHTVGTAMAIVVITGALLICRHQSRHTLVHGELPQPLPCPEMGEQHPETFQTQNTRSWWAGQLRLSPAHSPIGMLMLFLAFTDGRRQLPEQPQVRGPAGPGANGGPNQPVLSRLSHNPNGWVTKTS